MNVCPICNKKIDPSFYNSCMYCLRTCSAKCVAINEWDESVCLDCNRYMSLKTMFDNLLLINPELDNKIERHKYLKHSNPNICKVVAYDYFDPLDPVITVSCYCNVTEVKRFNRLKSQFKKLPYVIEDSALEEQALVDDFNKYIYDRDKGKGLKNVFYLHGVLCKGKLEFTNVIKWLRTQGLYYYELIISQIWLCKTCNLEFENLFKDNRGATVYE